MLRKHALVGFAVIALLATGTGIGTALAREASTARHDYVAMGEAEIHRLLLLMDEDKSGTVSRQEFTKYMDAEFARLEKDKNGEVPVAEPAPLNVRPYSFSTVGK